MKTKKKVRIIAAVSNARLKVNMTPDTEVTKEGRSKPVESSRRRPVVE